MMNRVNYKGAYENLLIATETYEKEIKRLNNIINKAIEYTDSCIFDYEENTMIGEDFKIIKNILKGSDKE